MEFKADSSIKRVMKNGFFTALSFAIYTLIGVFFIPYLVRHYGDGQYGLIALAGFLTQYIGFIAGCIGSSIGRFLNVSLNKGDWQGANEIFSTALVAILLLILCQLPFFIWGIWQLEFLIDFPPEVAADFRVMVCCNVAAFLISLFVGVLYTPMQAANRIDISLKLDVLWKLARVGVLIFLLNIFGPWLWIIGAVDLGLTVCGVVAAYYFYRRFAQNLIFKREHISWKWVKPVMNMAAWSVVAGLGQILFQKTDVWIINRFVDLKLAGVCAALLVWPNFVQQIAKNVSSLLQPVVMIDYAHGRFQRIRDLVLLGTLVFSVFSIFICGILLVAGDWLLELWMDESYRHYQWYVILMLLHFPLTLARETVWLVFPAFDKMQYLGISNLISGILNIILSIALVYMGYGLSGVLVATGISLVLQRTLFLSFFAAKLIEVSYCHFIRIYIPGLLVIAAVVIQKLVFKETSFMATGILCLTLGTGYLIRMSLFDTRVKRLINAVLGARMKEAVS